MRTVQQDVKKNSRFFGAEFTKSSPLKSVHQFERVVIDNALGTDNYFMTALMSIVHFPDGEAYLKGLLTEKDKSMDVKLFKDGKAVIVTIPKSSSANWVTYLQKAYAKMHQLNYSEIRTHKRVQGTPESVFEAFLGYNNRTDLCAFPYQSQKTLYSLIQDDIYGCNGKDIYTLAILFKPFYEKASKKNIETMLPELSLDSWWQWIQENQTRFNDFFEKKHPISRKDLSDFLINMSISIEQQKNVKQVINWIDTHKILSSQEGYNAEETACFNHIQAYLDNQIPVSVLSNKHVKQLMNERYYAVIGITSQNGQQFIQLKNILPERRSWLSRLFTPVSQSSVFEMELTDFCKNFSRMAVGRSLNEALKSQPVDKKSFICN